MSRREAGTPEIHELDGRCACGAVTVRACVPKTYGTCHCEMCRRWTGGVWMGVVCEGEPGISGPVNVWQSSKLSNRGSCKQCGSSIWHQTPKLGVMTLGQGLFDDQAGWKMVRQVCIEEKPDHYHFAEGQPFTKWGTFMAVLLGRMPR